MDRNKILVQVFDFLKTRLTLWFIFNIISAFLFLNVFPNNDPELWYITFSLWTMFMTMLVFELSILFIDEINKYFSIKPKKKPKPKFFEFGFFLSLFIATINVTYIVAMVFQPKIEDKDILEIIGLNFWFIGLYGVAIAFGIYHYIFRMDDDFPDENDNRKNNGDGSGYMDFGILGKIGLSFIVLFFILLGILFIFSITEDIIYSFTIGLITVGITLIALDLSSSTDKKIKHQMNGLFLQNLNFIEETRTIYNSYAHKHENGEEFLSWKTLQGVIVAWGLNKKIRKKSPIHPKYQDQLVRYFKTTMKCLFQGLSKKNKRWADLDSGQKGNFASAYAMVEDFYAEKKTWEALNKKLNDNMTKAELKDLIERKEKEKTKLHMH